MKTYLEDCNLAEREELRAAVEADGYLDWLKRPVLDVLVYRAPVTGAVLINAVGVSKDEIDTSRFNRNLTAMVEVLSPESKLNFRTASNGYGANMQLVSVQLADNEIPHICRSIMLDHPGYFGSVHSDNPWDFDWTMHAVIQWSTGLPRNGSYFGGPEPWNAVSTAVANRYSQHSCDLIIAKELAFYTSRDYANFMI